MTKALMGQAVGCSGLIIIDDTISASEDLFVMADDGFGFNVTMPAAMVTQRDGQRLVSAVRSGIPVIVSLSQELQFSYNMV